MKPLLPTPDHVVRGAVHWPYVITFATLHLSLLLVCVPWLFSWTGVVLAVLGLYIFGTLGINAFRCVFFKIASIPTGTWENDESSS